MTCADLHRLLDRICRKYGRTHQVEVYLPFDSYAELMGSFAGWYHVGSGGQHDMIFQHPSLGRVPIHPDEGDLVHVNVKGDRCASESSPYSYWP